MRGLGRKIGIAAAVLIVLCIMLFIYSSYFSRYKVVHGIVVSEDVLIASEEMNIDYCKLLKKAIKNDTASIKALTLLEFWNAISYDHGGVIVDLIGIIGEDNFLQSLATINNREKMEVDSYLTVGLLYNYSSKFHGKTLEEAFPKIYKFLDYDSDSVIAELLEKQAQESVFEIIDTLTVIKYDTLADERDGRTYRTVKIGRQTWMAQNLNYEISNGSWCYENNADSCKKYGRLYTWNAAMKACPNGWKLPDSADWIKLLTTAGGKKTAGKKLKAKRGWNKGNGADDYGFSALPGGYRDIDDDFLRNFLVADGKFTDAGEYGNWWTATENSAGNVYNRYMGFYSDYLYEGNNNKNYGFSVRCVADMP
jgi:uncharacterized protein (TIGR02145 family)